MSTHQTRGFALKRLHAVPLLLGILFSSGASPVNAQSDTTTNEMPLTREQVKRERDEFIRMHRWDPVSDNYVLNPFVEPPKGMKTRAEVKAERDEFLRTHRYDHASESWIPMLETQRNKSSLTRAQVKEETRQFLRTHEWDTNAETWVEKQTGKKK